jgi:3,4-dihydroxyphenylacetate 2,3-dioxygenase
MPKNKGKGAIVGATLTTHVPRLFLEGEAREKYIGTNPSSFFEALPRMYEEQIKGRDFDTFLVIDTHWWTTVDFIINGNYLLNGVYTSDEIPEMIQDYMYRYVGDRELACCISNEAREKGLPVNVCKNPFLPVHYPTLVPMHYLNPEKKYRVLIMSVAYTSSAEQELRYGEAIREAVERLGRKVVIVASGGLSHKFWPLEGIKEHAGPDLANIPEFNRWFDEKIIEWFKEGNHNSVLASVDSFRQRCSPEGRFAHYLRMVGAIGGAGCTLKGIQYGNYEAAIGTGQVILWFNA